MKDSLVYFGGEVKALDDTGRVGGVAVRHTNEERKDLAGDFFDAESYLGAREGDGCDTLFHHGIPLKTGLEGFADHLFAPMKKVRRDEVGLWVETVLDLSDEYEKKVFELIKAGKIGFSSGAPAHMVKREENGRLKRWPIAEISFTPQPCEFENRVYTLKALDGLKYVPLEGVEAETERPTLVPSKPALAAKLSQHVEDLVDDGHTREDVVGSMAASAGLKAESVESMLEGSERPADANLKAFCRALKLDYDALKAIAHRDYLQTVKGMFETALSESVPSRWELEAVLNKIISKLVAAAAASTLAGVTFDLKGKIREAVAEYAARLEDLAYTQGVEHIESGSDEHFYLKAIMDLGSDLPVSDGLDLDDHSQVVVSASKGLYARFRANHEARVKSGRVLSDKNRTRLSAFRERLQELDRDIASLLEESTPMASDSEKRAAETTFLRLQRRNHQLGVN
jgi:hypothetical protein